MNCGNCGFEVNDDEVFCLNCGSRIETDKRNKNQSYESNQIPYEQKSAIQMNAVEKKEPAMFIYIIMGMAIVGVTAIIIWGGFYLYKMNNDARMHTESKESSSLSEDEYRYHY